MSKYPICSLVRIDDKLSGDLSRRSGTAIKWNLCCICQTKTDDALQCPSNSKKPNAGAGYKTLAENLKAFEEHGALPEWVKMKRLDEGDGIEATLKSHEAKFHSKCRDQFNTTKVQRLRKKRKLCIGTLSAEIGSETDISAAAENDQSEKADSMPVDKYARVVAICNNLALIVSQCEMDQFIVRVKLLTHLQLYWTKGCNVTLQPEPGVELDDCNWDDDLVTEIKTEAMRSNSNSFSAEDESLLDRLRVGKAVSPIKAKDKAKTVPSVTARQLPGELKVDPVEDNVGDATNDIEHYSNSNEAAVDQTCNEDDHLNPVTLRVKRKSSLKFAQFLESASGARKRKKICKDDDDDDNDDFDDDGDDDDDDYDPDTHDDDENDDNYNISNSAAQKRLTSATSKAESEKSGDRLSDDKLLRDIIDWNLCCVCQSDTGHGLTCSANCSGPIKGFGYKTLAADLKTFEELEALPEYVKIRLLDEGDGIEATLMAHQAKFHKKCRSLFNATQIQRVLKRKERAKVRAANGTAEPAAAQKDKSEKSALECLSEDEKIRHNRKGTYECPHCKYTCAWKHNIERHIKKHSIVFPCTMCDMKFMRAISLRVHMRTHIDGYYKCSYCEKTYINNKKLRAHLENHTKKFECTICNKIYTRAPELRNHMYKHKDNAVYPYNCSHCSKGFPILSMLTSHTNKHTKPFKCSTCSHNFASKSLLQSHMVKHEGDQSELIYLCPVCEKVFGTKEKLSKHLKCHDNICNVCGKSFKRRQGLRLHMSKHVDTLLHPITCGTCDQSFPSFTLLNIHKKLHVNPHKCEICNEKFASKETLVSHMDRHDVKQHLKCRKCDQICSSGTELKAHRKMHTTVKSELCTVCGKSFSKRKINSHLQRHSSVHPYSCKFCGKSFSQKYNRRMHERIHTGEKPFTCNTCGKGFLVATTLMYHKNVHTGERPFSCEVCGETFGNPTTRCIHMKKHRAKDMFTV